MANEKPVRLTEEAHREVKEAANMAGSTMKKVASEAILEANPTKMVENATPAGYCPNCGSGLSAGTLDHHPLSTATLECPGCGSEVPVTEMLSEPKNQE